LVGKQPEPCAETGANDDHHEKKQKAAPARLEACGEARYLWGLLTHGLIVPRRFVADNALSELKQFKLECTAIFVLVLLLLLVIVLDLLE